MNKHKMVFLFLLIFLRISPTICGQEISLDDFLGRLMQTHPLFEKENLNSQIERESRQSLLGTRDWNIFSQAKYSHYEMDQSNSLLINGGLDRLFWKTGGLFSASYSFNRVDREVNPMFGFPDTYYQNRFEFSYTHPLLQNRNGFLDRLQYELGQYNVESASENQEDFLFDAALKFVDWAFLSQQKIILNERLNLSNEALENIREKRKENLVDELDVLRAEDAVRISKQYLSLAESQWKGLQSELAVLANDDEIYRSDPGYDLYETAALPPLDEEIQKINRDSRLVNVLDIQIQQLEQSRLGYKETIKPRLSLLAELSFNKTDPEFGDAFNVDKPDILGGLVFSVPLERTTAKSNVATAGLQIDQLQKQRDETIVSLTAALTNLHIQIVELEKILLLNREQVESARAKTVEELKLYNQGRSDLTFVIQSQDGEQNAKLNYAMNAANYHKLVLQYRALTDKLLAN
jgi:outer membrane protein TolC